MTTDIEVLGTNTDSIIERIRSESDVQIRFERDRAKRLAYKVEELKDRTKKLKTQVEEKDEICKRAHHGWQVETSQNLAEVMESHQTLCQFIQSQFLQIFDSELADETDVANSNFDVTVFKEQANALVHELLYLRRFVNRLLSWRSDLRYQKLYLSLKCEDLLARLT